MPTGEDGSCESRRYCRCSTLRWSLTEDILSRAPGHFRLLQRRLIPKCREEHRPKASPVLLREKDKMGTRLTLSGIHYNVAGIETVGDWHRDR